MRNKNIYLSIFCLIIITVSVVHSLTALNSWFAPIENFSAIVNYEQPKYMAGLSIPNELFIPPRTWSTTGGLQFDAKPNVSFPVTSNKVAQFYINRGLTTLYAFNQNDACTLFLRAAVADPTCGFAYAAAAYAINMNINHVAINTSLLKLSLDAFRKAYAMKDTQSDLVKAWIVALSYRFFINGDITHSGNTSPTPQQITILMQQYSDKMKLLYKTAGDYSSDIAVLYAASIMMVHPWKWWKRSSLETGWKQDIGDLAINDSNSVLGILQKVIDQNPDHIGANHYFIHACEESPVPGLAVDAATTLASLGAFGGHIEHMPSHTYFRLGKYIESINANIKAMHVNKTYAAYMRKFFPHFNSYFIMEYVAHEPHFLIMSAMHLGNWAYCKSTFPFLKAHVLRYLDHNPFLAHFLAVPLLVTLRFGFFDQVIDYKYPQKYETVNLLLVDLYYAKAVAYAYMGDLEQAAKYYILLKEKNKRYISPPQQGTAGHHGIDSRSGHGGGHRSGGIVSPHTGAHKRVGMGAEVQGTATVNNTVRVAKLRELVAGAILAWARQQQTLALQLINQACNIYENLFYDEPRSFYYPPHETLASFLYQTGQYKECIRAAKRALKLFPRTVRAIHCIIKAHDNLGNHESAALVRTNYGNALEHVDLSLDIRYF